MSIIKEENSYDYIYTKEAVDKIQYSFMTN